MITSSDLTLKELLLDQRYLFRVSNYQRHYVWTVKEVRQFLADGEFCWKQKQEGSSFVHFAGQISLRVISEERDGRRKVEIVDGQQRLTTFLLLAAIGARMIQIECGLAAEAEEFWKKYMISHAECGKDMERLELSRTDQKFWGKLTCQGEARKLSVTAESHKHLQAAADSIEAYLRAFVKDKEKTAAGQVIREYIDTSSIAIFISLCML